MGHMIDELELDDSMLEDTRLVEKFYIRAGIPEEEVGLLLLRHAIFVLFKSKYYDGLDADAIFAALAEDMANEVKNAINQVGELKEGAEEDRAL